MNYKAFFLLLLSMSSVPARYESIATSFALEKTDKAVIVTLDTGKKVTAQDIEILHKDKFVTVAIKGLDHTLNLSLEASKNMLNIGMCSEKEESENQKYVYHGSSCMRQAISARVSLTDITAEYKGTKLILSVPVVAQEPGKKIPVVVTQEVPLTLRQVPSHRPERTMVDAQDERPEMSVVDEK